MKHRLLIYTFPFLSLLFSCASNTVHYKRTVEQFATLGVYHLYQEGSSVLDEIVVLGNKIDASLDRYKTTSDLYKLNHSEAPIEASPYLIECLCLSDSYLDRLGGYFSYTLGDVKDLYMEAFASKRLPDTKTLQARIEEAKQTKVIIDGNKVQRVGKGSIDLGGIAKGYFLKKAAEILKAKQRDKYLLNVGSSSMLLGDSNIGDGRFEITPKGHQNLKFYAKSTSLSTSSIDQQSYVIDDVTYSHIIDPHDGNAIPNYDMVTFIGEDPCFLDAATTACMHMDADQIKALGLKGFALSGEDVKYRYGLD